MSIDRGKSSRDDKCTANNKVTHGKLVKMNDETHCTAPSGRVNHQRDKLLTREYLQVVPVNGVKKEQISLWTVDWTIERGVHEEYEKKESVSLQYHPCNVLLSSHLLLAHCHPANGAIKSIALDANEVTCCTAPLQFTRSLGASKSRCMKLKETPIHTHNTQSNVFIDTNKLHKRPHVTLKSDRRTISYTVHLLLQLIVQLTIHTKLVAGKDFILHEKSSADEEMLAFLIGFVLFVSILAIGTIISKCIWPRPFKYNRSESKLLAPDLHFDCENAITVNSESPASYYSSEDGKCKLDHRLLNTIASASLKHPSMVTTSFVYRNDSSYTLKDKVIQLYHRVICNIATFLYELIPWDLVEEDDEEDDDDAEDTCENGNAGDSDESDVDDDQQGIRSYQLSSGEDKLHLQSKEDTRLIEPFHATHSHQYFTHCDCKACKSRKSPADDGEEAQFMMEERGGGSVHQTAQCKSLRVAQSLGYVLSAVCAADKDHSELPLMKRPSGHSIQSPTGHNISSSEESKLLQLKQSELKIAKPSHFQQVSYL